MVLEFPRFVGQVARRWEPSSVVAPLGVEPRSLDDGVNCKPFANGSDITGPHGTRLDETATRRFVERSPLDRPGSVQADGSRMSSSPPSDTRNRWYCNALGASSGVLRTVC